MEMVSTQRPRFTQGGVRVGAPGVKRRIFLIQNVGTEVSPVKKTLQERGYEVVHADSVQTAFRAWARLVMPIDLFIADMGFSRDDEIERLIKGLQAENPRLRVLFANDLDEPTGPGCGQRYATQLAAVVANCLP